MKKYIVFLSLAIMMAASGFAAETAGKISGVHFEGLKNVKEKTVKSQIKSKVGKPYSEDTVKNDIQTILGLNYFDNVEVNVDTAPVRITFDVTEKPYIKTIALKGNKKISSGRLKEEITLKEKEFYDAAKFEESKAKIRTLYGDKGYTDAQLEAYPTVDEQSNKMTVTFLITEGNRITVNNISLDALAAYKPKKILGLMKTRKKKIYKPETLSTDRQEVETFYKNNGYREAAVGEPVVTYNEERTFVDITLPINEGPRYKIGAITFSPNDNYTDEAMRNVLVIKPGQVYREDEFEESRHALAELFSDKGYLHTQIEPEFKTYPEKGVMDINFVINEGSIVYLGKVYIDGLTTTKENVIRRELTLKEGDVFAAPRVRRSIEKIYNLGFIDAVEPGIQPTEKPDVMDMVLNVTEGKPGVLSAGAGYSSVDQLVGTLQVQHINLLGRAQRLNLLWEFGSRKQNGEIDWTEPWFLNHPTSLGFGIFDTERVRDYSTELSAYKEGRRGGSLRVGPRINDYLSFLFSYTYEEVSVFDIEVSTTFAPDLVAAHDITSSISSQVVWDSRDNIFDANRGSRHSLSVQFAGGPLDGNVNFIKSLARTSWFFPSFWKFVFSVNGNFGIIENFGNSTNVPIYERFHVGGVETVRGYLARRGEIGTANGGKAMLVLNAEYKFPIVQEKKRTILQGAFFADAGGSWDSMYDFSLDFGTGPTNMKAGVGFGIRFTTPVFPLRLDWGYGLHHNPGEELNQFYFTIGSMF
ncbi:MAG: outer membrane protein assembly factor BamA [Elusimicrobia bacterium RIFOXYA2_FULL_50_26]|nr:MAG: outer membrane protein assembly factor BamA [Elusimicrobia bacterium RIFOXYA2_FULL_50_26]